MEPLEVVGAVGSRGSTFSTPSLTLRAGRTTGSLLRVRFLDGPRRRPLGGAGGPLFAGFVVEFSLLDMGPRRELFGLTTELLPVGEQEEAEAQVGSGGTELGMVGEQT